MKLMGILLVVFFTHCFYAMEASEAYICGTTKINIKTCSPCDEKGKVKSIVVETNARKLLKKIIPDEYLVGHIDITFAKENKQKLQSKYIHVVEPILYTSQYSGYCYYVEKQYKDSEYPFGIKYRGKEAFNEACKDLGLCYKNVLILGIIYKEKIKSMALPIIGKAVGFPKEKAVEIAVSEICQFITKYPQAYSYIDLCVDDLYEAQLCKDQLTVYCDWKEIQKEDVNICCIV